MTLIGYSLGARVIFYCLTEMARRPGLCNDNIKPAGCCVTGYSFPDCQGIVEDAVLLGAPVSGNADSWAPLTKVVAGRLVNGYTR